MASSIGTCIVHSVRYLLPSLYIYPIVINAMTAIISIYTGGIYLYFPLHETNAESALSCRGPLPSSGKLQALCRHE